MGDKSIHMHVNDADALADAWRAAGAEVTGPDDFDYGKREGAYTAIPTET